jgi:AbrB family looped-hinge helix DNA binding protein
MYLYESKIGKKYQTVIPLQIRETAGIQEGDSLVWEVNPDGSFQVSAQKSKTEHLAKLNRRTYGTFDHAVEHAKKEKAEWND